jgi:hypothetical protein
MTHHPGSEMSRIEGSVTALPAHLNAKARRAVASRAVDADDARLLMEALGLIAPLTPSPAWRRANTPRAAS